jgi:hypothetical protein
MALVLVDQCAGALRGGGVVASEVLSREECRKGDLGIRDTLNRAANEEGQWTEKRKVFDYRVDGPNCFDINLN